MTLLMVLQEPGEGHEPQLVLLATSGRGKVTYVSMTTEV